MPRLLVHPSLPRILLGWHPRRSAAAALILLATGLLEGLSLLTLIPLLSLVGVDTGAPLGSIEGLVQAALQRAGIPLTLVSVLAVFVALQLATAALSLAQARVAFTLQHRIVDRVRRRVRGALDAMTWRHHRQLEPARIAHVLTTDADRVGAASYFLLTLATGGAVLIVHVALAIRLEPILASGVAVAGILLVAALRGATTKAQSRGEDLTRHMREMHHRVIEWVAASKLGRIQGSHPFPHESRVLEAQVGAIHDRARTRFLFDAATVVLLATVTIFAVGSLQMSTGSFLLLAYLLARILPRANQWFQQLQMYRQAAPAWVAVQELWAHANEHREADARPIRPMKDGLAVRQVRLDHDGQVVLDDVELTIKRGERVALTGPSGAGKTTLAEVCMGLWPDAGTFTVDGETLDDGQQASWRRRVALVPQEPHLMETTVRGNLLWAAPDADETQMQKALDAAGCAFLAARRGLETQVGHRGQRLSGGERQRVALAMALLRSPDLLVLDEPTSNLDAEAERSFTATIRALDQTILLVTHRPGPLAAADRIVTMANGRIQ